MMKNRLLQILGVATIGFICHTWSYAGVSVTPPRGACTAADTTNFEAGDKLVIAHATADTLVVGDSLKATAIRVQRLKIDSLLSTINLFSTGDAAIQLRSYSETQEDAGLTVFLRARGTAASPTVVADDDELGEVRWRGWEDEWVTTARILVEADGDWADDATDAPSRMSFFTTPDGSATYQERMTIVNSGRIGIGDDTPDSLLTVAGGISATGGAQLTGLVTVGGNAAQADEKVYLYFDGDRDWQFLQDGDDASADLALRSITGGKSFSVQSPDGDKLIDFVADDDTPQIGISAGAELRLNGNKLTLDADDDSYIYSLTDDIISVVSSGSSVLNIIANGDVLPTSDNAQNFGSAAATWDSVFAQDVDAGADIPFLDDMDDLGAIRGIKVHPDSLRDARGRLLVDDWTLPKVMMLVHKAAGADTVVNRTYDMDSTTTVDGVAYHKVLVSADTTVVSYDEGDLVVGPSGRPFFSLRATVGLILGALKQGDIAADSLAMRVDVLEDQVDTMMALMIVIGAAAGVPLVRSGYKLARKA